MNWHFYHKETGILHPKAIHTSSAEEGTALNFAQRNAPEDHFPIEGLFDRLCQKVNVATGSIEPYVPDAPNSDHEWDEASKRWQLSAPVEWRQSARAAAIAKINSLESQQPRILRELVLGHEGAKERLEALDKQISELRPATK